MAGGKKKVQTQNFLTTDQMLERFSLSKNGLQNLKNKGLPYYKLSYRKVVFREDEVNDWLAKHRVKKTNGK